MAHWIRKLKRLLHHRWTEGKVRVAFPPDVLSQLASAVRASEALHTGQIRLCVEGGLPYSYIWRNAPARERAVTLFGKLRTWDTEYNNGVLIYLLLADHAIEIVADRAAARCASQADWEVLVHEMQSAFQRQAYAEGMALALQRVSALLQTHFPRTETGPSAAFDNNLPDAPVVQGRYFKNR